jgi:predicted GNAT family acetyltransferase
MSERDVVDVTESHRFELRVEGDVAGFVEYEQAGGDLVLTHTVVEPAFEGQGIGSALARGALDAARERGLAVVPRCPFIQSWLRKHPDDLDLVPVAQRDELVHG